MKLLFMCVLSSAIILKTNAQNPEAGWFWALKVEEVTLDKASGKPESMGWTEIPTGKYEHSGCMLEPIPAEG